VRSVMPARRWAAGALDPAGGRLPDGWRAVFSEAYKREYFWHEGSGATTWERPGPPEAELSSGGADRARRRPRVREFPDGWCAVYSPEYDREYYWHRPSGQTTWEPPALPAAANTPAVAADPGGGRALLERFGGNWRELRRAAWGVLHELELGEHLRGGDLELVRTLLEHHPDRAAKVGAGVQGIKVDASLHESGSRCFWVLRTDGSVEDFSVRRCLERLHAACRRSA